MIRKNAPLLLLFFAAILSLETFGQTPKESQLNPKLVGTWEFLILHDKNGKKVDTIKHPIGYEIPAGPLLTYKADGTYAMKFTPQNTDNGKWYFDMEKQAIIEFLYYSKPYSLAAKYFIDKGYAKKDENGDYYEMHTTKVIELSDDKLTVLEREGRQRTFVKKKE